MSHAIYFRLTGYVVTLVMHVVNIVAMKAYVTEEALKDPQVQFFISMEHRFFTSWTFILQILYASFGLVCDVILLTNASNKHYKLPKLVTSTRDIMFSGLVWPCTMGVFSVFWSVYLYDRKLIFPEFLDKIIPPASNHIIHTVILPVILWEVVFRPRRVPKAHSRNIAQLILHLVTYVAVMVYTYVESGLWLYPLFGVLGGWGQLTLVFLLIGIVFIFWYYVQWPLTYLIHGSCDTVKRKVN